MATRHSHQVTKVKLEGLQNHPEQHVYFAGDTAGKLEDLAANIEEHGLLNPILLAPDGATIISGHRRVAAARLLGWTEIDAVVRKDLAGNELAIELLFHEENSVQRQQGVLQHVRSTKRRVEIERELKGKSFQSNKKTRDIVGERVGLSGRQVDRLLLVLETPAAVQAAFEANKITAVLAGQVAKLPEHVQATIALEIEEQGLGESKRIIGQYLPKKMKKKMPQGPHDALRSLVDAVAKAVSALDGNAEQAVRLDAASVAQLKQGADLIAKLIAR